MLLTEQEIEDVAIFIMNKDTFDMKTLGLDFARAIEFAVLEKIKAQGSGYFIWQTGKESIRLYRLPEGD